MNLTKRRAARILRDAANLLIESGLAKGVYRDRNGAYCAVGAISQSICGFPSPTAAGGENVEKICKAICRVGKIKKLTPVQKFSPRWSLQRESDRDSMTKGQMAHLLRRTAAALEHGAAL